MDFRNIRRVVTGHDADGKAVITSDGIVQALYSRPDAPGRGMADIWKGDRLPVPPGEARDLSLDGPVQLLPPAGGFVVRVVEMPPESPTAAGTDHADYFASMGAGQVRAEGARHPAMHKTATLDIVFVLSGEIWAILEEGEVLLRQGDVLVQRATLHAWSNRSDKPCLLAGVLLSQEPA